MAASSILESVRLNNPKSAEMFIDALDAASEMPIRKSSEIRYHLEKDPNVIKRLMNKTIEAGKR